MKGLYRHLVLLAICLVLCISAEAQRISLTANVSAFSYDQIDSKTDTEINYESNSTISLNARVYNKKRWALRVGAERDDISYSVGDNLQTLYDADRRDFVALFGIEKHFLLADFVDIYPGILVPVTFTGEQTIQDEMISWDDERIFASPAIVLGINVKLLKIIRLGIEADMSYDNFKTQIWSQTENGFSDVKISNLDYTTSITVGVAF